VTDRSQLTRRVATVAAVDSTGPGIEVARALRRALAAAGWKAVAVGVVVVGGDAAVAGSTAALAAVRRGLGRFADGVVLLKADSVDTTMFADTSVCLIAVDFRHDGGATVTAHRLREVAG
jgi:hypothetical protein